jgi:cytochrome c
MRTYLRKLSVSVCVAAGLTSGCNGGQITHSYTVRTGGSADRGRATMIEYGCGKCHTVPGIREAKGVVGPPLTALSRRTFIGGNFANTPDNLVHWVMSPKAMKPRTAMPDLGLSEEQARDVAAYLYTLQ